MKVTNTGTKSVESQQIVGINTQQESILKSLFRDKREVFSLNRVRRI